MQIHVDLLLIRLVGSWGMSGSQAQRIQGKVYIHLHTLLSNKLGLFYFFLLLFSREGHLSFMLFFLLITSLILPKLHSVTLPVILHSLTRVPVVSQKQFRVDHLWQWLFRETGVLSLQLVWKFIACDFQIKRISAIFRRKPNGKSKHNNASSTRLMLQC